MKRTISRLFQDNQHKLTQAPPPRAWRRLDRRLNAHRPSGKWALYKQVAAVAAILLVVALLSVISTYLQRIEKLTATHELQELKANDQDSETMRTVAYARQFRDQLANAIEEGDFTKRLSLSLPATESQLKVSISDFKWLEGEWKSNADGQQSVETWKRQSAQMLEGTGIVQRKGETVFTEKMRIYNTGTKIYFEMPLANGEAPVRYALKQFFADRMVFENTALDFPQQVIIDKHSSNIYSLILQNAEPVGLSKSELDYLNHRNSFINQHIIRVMERVDYQ